MTDQPKYDCVASTREVRDRISATIEQMSYEGLRHWLRSREYADPTLRRLAEQVAQQAAAEATPLRD